ncbi:sugar phosphate isomerase/epimerase family protein [Nocardia fluminea]|uniref:sugar phosphate isomerase/epimerase family protein n=1 Tax=Nocardia fluminea TaxID=134984 RepID=UPI003421FBE7
MRRDLVLSVGTIGDVDFGERVEAAVAGGYHGIGMSVGVARRAREGRWDWASMRALLDSYGLRVVELDSVVDWAVADRAALQRHCEHLFTIADELGGEYLLACTDVPTTNTSETTDRLTWICAEARRHGVGVGVEFLPWVSVNSIPAAEELARRAAASNAGIIIDVWHFLRAGGTLEHLAAMDPELVLGIQISAPALEPADDPIFETLHRRHLPGDKDAVDILPVLRALLRSDVRAPWAVEVFSDTLRNLPAAEAALSAATAAQQALEQASTTQEVKTVGPQHLR